VLHDQLPSFGSSNVVRRKRPSTAEVNVCSFDMCELVCFQKFCYCTEHLRTKRKEYLVSDLHNNLHTEEHDKAVTYFWDIKFLQCVIEVAIFPSKLANTGVAGSSALWIKHDKIEKSVVSFISILTDAFFPYFLVSNIGEKEYYWKGREVETWCNCERSTELFVFTKPIRYCPMCRRYILQRMYSLYEICEYTCLHCKGSFEEVQDIISCYCCGNKIHCPGSLLSCDISIDVMVYQFQGSVDHWICPFCCFMISQLVTSGSFKVLSEVDDPFRLDVNKTVRARRNRRVSFDVPDAVQNLSEEFSAESLVPEESRFEMEVISEGLMPDVSQIQRGGNPEDLSMSELNSDSFTILEVGYESSEEIQRIEEVIVNDTVIAKRKKRLASTRNK
jgi:hypothetical protein